MVKVVAIVVYYFHCFAFVVVFIAMCIVKSTFWYLPVGIFFYRKQSMRFRHSLPDWGWCCELWQRQMSHRVQMFHGTELCRLLSRYRFLRQNHTHSLPLHAHTSNSTKKYFNWRRSHLFQIPTQAPLLPLTLLGPAPPCSVPPWTFLHSAERRPLYITTVENVGVVPKTSVRWTMDLRPGTKDMWPKQFSRSNKYTAMIMRVLLIFLGIDLYRECHKKALWQEKPLLLYFSIYWMLIRKFLKKFIS